MSDRQFEKRQAILVGATDVFRRQGYESASMDRIAEVAEVSKRTVYNHFGSKEALFGAVVHQLLDELEAVKTLEWDASRPLGEQLKELALAKSRITSDADVRALVKVVLGVAVNRPAFAQAIARRAHAGDEHLATFLRDAEIDGAARVPDPGRAASLFWSMISGALFWPSLFEGPMDADERETILDDVISTFLARFGAG